MKIIISILLSLILVNLLSSCSTSSQTKIAGNYSYKSECLGVEGDGSQTLKSWGAGRNRFDAFAQAQKNALLDVIFKGISDGKSECEVRPLVPEVNARQKYDSYFNEFFKDGGEYRNFVSMSDERLENKLLRDRKEGVGTVTHSAIIKVKRPQLKEKLIADGILK